MCYDRLPMAFDSSGLDFRRILFYLLVATACGVAVGCVILFRMSWGEPSLAHDLIASARFARSAPRLAADAPPYLAPPPIARGKGVTTPWHVGIQVGHLDIAELPPEQYLLRGGTGAQWRSISEVEVNLQIAQRVARQLREAGVTVDLLPATVPRQYTADAFVAIHADSGRSAGQSGWKVSAPWRSSEASRALRDALALAYSRMADMPEDRYGVTYNMRGYYAFSWNRYLHAVSASTPSAIIETGFLTSSSDRRLIVNDPERAARGISLGILFFLRDLAGMKSAALVPLAFPPMMVTAESAALRYYPGEEERIAARLPTGTRVRAMDEQDGWIELVVMGDFRVFGWMKLSDLKLVAGG